MIEHESDLWPERRWALELLGSEVVARPFRSAEERRSWIKALSLLRCSVGKRHPAVKALRQQWRQEALEKLAVWRARHQ